MLCIVLIIIVPPPFIAWDEPKEQENGMPFNFTTSLQNISVRL